MSVQRYIQRMDASIEDKMKVVQCIPDDAEYVLDVGCATGHVTNHMANLRPDTFFHGIDTNIPFVSSAKPSADNVGFSDNWLSDLHDRPTRYEAITFMSVLHEFYSYGKGITSVVKALCDAYELLNPDGVIIIRDMLRPDNKMDEQHERMSLNSKIAQVIGSDKYTDYSNRNVRGAMNWLSLNDLALHTLYMDNWENEVREQYMFWSAEDYAKFGKHVLGMEIEAFDCYLLDYVKERWRKELWLNEMECSNLYSTGILVLRK